jgi:tRNA(Ile)-lysidine synthase
MLKKFIAFIQQNNLFNEDETILLAISGGLDSMVMLSLFIEAKFKIAVAHANFKLRGEESEGDEAFVRIFCESKGIPFFTTTFDTNNYAAEKKISIQMAARELRYQWFRQLMKEKGFTKIATAHHADDQAETIFLNMVKGEGLNGLTGMPLNKRNVIRPLMFATKENLEHFARNTSLKWREDSSNKEDNYQRNFIRHQIFPRLHKINPGLNESLLRTSLKAKGEMEILKFGLEAIKQSYFNEDDNGWITIKKTLMENFKEPSVIWRALDQFGFTLDQCEEIVGMDHQSGKFFLSPTHRLLMDREVMIVQPLISESTTDPVEITGQGIFKMGPVELKCRIAVGHFSNKASEAWLDLEKLKFPLTWRKWKEGDRIIPLGMSGFKKVSDLLIDEKISLAEKETITVVESNGEIVWVVGVRIDERVKQSDHSKRSFVLSLVGFPKAILK